MLSTVHSNDNVVVDVVVVVVDSSTGSAGIAAAKVAVAAIAGSGVVANGAATFLNFLCKYPKSVDCVVSGGASLANVFF